MGSPRAPGAADRLLRSRAPRAKRLADERRAFGAPTDFVTPARLKRFASLSKRARRSITSFSRSRSRSLSSSRVVIVDERSLARALAGQPDKRTRQETRTVSFVPRRHARTSRRTADRSRATEREFERAWRHIHRRRRRARSRVAPSRRTSRRASRGSTRRVTTRRRSSRFSWR